MNEVGGAPANILIIAGSDCSAKAGLQRDLQVAWAAGLGAQGVMTAVSAQTSKSVLALDLVTPELVGKQMEACFANQAIDAIKIGMLGNAEIVETVFAALLPHTEKWIVVDPVMASSSGTRLLDEEGVRALQRVVQGRSKILLTPNLPELAVLIGDDEAHNEKRQRNQAEELHRKLGCAILAKGGHGEGETSCDMLVNENRVEELRAKRLPGTLRGSGCALSTRIACELARGNHLLAAVQNAKELVLRELSRAIIGN